MLKNKSLLNLFELSNNIKLYIPSTIEGNKACNTTKEINNTLELFSSLFGGATSSQNIGAWNSKELGLITESITIINSFTTSEQLSKSLEVVIQYAYKLKEDLKQESISLEVNNKLYLL